MGHTANLTRSQVLAAGFRKYGDGIDKKRVCLSYAFAGLIAMAHSDTDNPSPLTLIIDLDPAHTQTKFNKKSGSARINASNMDIAELILQHVFDTIMLLSKGVGPKFANLHCFRYLGGVDGITFRKST